MYEHRSHPLLPRRAFLQRVLRHAGYAAALVLGSLLVGTAGYHIFAHQDWIDSFLNASMLLGGMGPVGELVGAPGKIFAALFALYSGLVFLIVAGLLFAPIFHRLMHRFHLEEDDNVAPAMSATDVTAAAAPAPETGE